MEKASFDKYVNEKEPLKPPSIHPQRDLVQFFTCTTCELVSFQDFEDLLLHQKESHSIQGAVRSCFLENSKFFVNFYASLCV